MIVVAFFQVSGGRRRHGDQPAAQWDRQAHPAHFAGVLVCEAVRRHHPLPARTQAHHTLLQVRLLPAT